MTSNKKKPLFFDIEAGGLSGRRSSIYSLSYSRGESLTSLYARPVPGTTISNWSKRNVWDPIKKLGVPIGTEKRVLSKFLQTVEAQKGGTIAGWNIGYVPDVQSDIPGTGPTGFDIPMIMTRAGKYPGMRERYKQAFQGVNVRDIGLEYSVRLARGLQSYPHLIDEKLFGQITGYNKQIDKYLADRPGATVPEIARHMGESGYRLAGWKQETIYGLMFPGKKYAAHQSEADIGAVRELARAAPNLNVTPEFATAWNKEALKNTLVSTLTRGHGHSYQEALSRAEKFGISDYFQSSLLDEVRSRGGNIDAVRAGKGLREGNTVVRASGLASAVERLGQAFSGLGRGIFAGAPGGAGGVGGLLDVTSSFAAKHKYKLGFAALALGLYATKPLSIFNAKDDSYNTIEGLPHGGVAEKKRRQMTDFGSGYQGENKKNKEKGSGVLTALKWGAGIQAGFTALQFAPMMGLLGYDASINLFNSVRGDLTGRTRLYHGTSTEAASSIKQEGLRQFYSNKVGTITNQTLSKKYSAEHLGKYVYLEKSKLYARTYAAQSHHIKAGRTAAQAQALIGANPFSIFSDKAKNTLAFDIPLWKEEFSSKLKRNPEIAKFADWKEYHKDLTGGSVDLVSQFKSYELYKTLNRSHAFDTNIPADYLRGSSTFKGVGIREFGEYVSKNPKQFARGVGKAGALLAAAGYLGYAAYNTIEGLPHKGEAGKSRKKNTDFGSGYQGDKSHEREVRDRFKLISRSIEKYGTTAGTGHKRLLIEKSKLGSEEDIEKILGFVPVKIAIPEAGQDTLVSWRHPTMNYHIHSHGDEWTIHEDRHAAATMKVRAWHDRVRRAAKSGAHAANTSVLTPIKEFLSGIPHIFQEGIPGAYYYLKGQLTGAEDMEVRLRREMKPEYQKFVSHLSKLSSKGNSLFGRIKDRIFSGRDDIYNTIEGLRHGGMAEEKRHEMTDFGSGWIRKALSKGIITPERIEKIATAAGRLSKTPASPLRTARLGKLLSADPTRAIKAIRNQMPDITPRIAGETKFGDIVRFGGERFRVGKEIGRGGFGTAYMARGLKTNRQGVFKTMKEFRHDPNAVFAGPSVINEVERLLGTEAHTKEGWVNRLSDVGPEGIKLKGYITEYMGQINTTAKALGVAPNSLAYEAKMQTLARQQMGNVVPEVYGVSERGMMSEYGGRAVQKGTEEHARALDWMEEKWGRNLNELGEKVRNFDPRINNILVGPNGEFRMIDFGVAAQGPSLSLESRNVAEDLLIRYKQSGMKSIRAKLIQAHPDSVKLAAENAVNPGSRHIQQAGQMVAKPEKTFILGK